VAALRAEGHEVESVHTLRLEGLENGRLFQNRPRQLRPVLHSDRGFVNNVRDDAQLSRLRMLRVTLPQKPQDAFILDFVSAFRITDWERFRHGDDWP